MKIFPVYYFPPVSWFSAALHAGDIVLERHEFYRKQHYFNRTRILAANKVLKLTIPIVKAREHTPLHQREISFAENWARDHWISITSAYRSSPYFEFYEDRIERFFTDVNPNLFDHNLATIQFFIDALQLDIRLSFSDQFHGEGHYAQDFRPDFPARNAEPPTWFKPVPYQQVFGDSFAADLSMLDLLCNLGPRSVHVLRESYQPAESVGE